MKILHYSDFSSPDFLSLYEQCDVLVSTGDLSLPDFFGLEDISDKKPAFGVYGNHDSGNYLESLGIINLHNKVSEHTGLKWGGFQGCPRYKNGPFMYTEEEAKIWSNTFPYVDVLLLHAGAKDSLDDSSDEIHIGSKHIRNYILQKQPKFVFCGHQYSNAQMTTGNTQIFRTYGAKIIHINPSVSAN